MKLPEIKHYIDRLGRMNYMSWNCSVSYDEKTYALLNELFAVLQKVEPAGNARKTWELWLRAERGAIEDYGNYDELLEEGEVESYEDFEQQWKMWFPDEVEWLNFGALQDEDIDYRAIFLRNKFIIELDPRKGKGPVHEISPFMEWMLGAVKEAVAELEAGTYNERIRRELPPQHRTGTILRKHLWKSWPDNRDAIMGRMTEADVAYFLENAQEELSASERRLPEMTANDFFGFCAMGYRANDYPDAEKSPREQYYCNADGRDEGLGELDPDDTAAFDDWYTNRPRRGGHPWEVCRGGNSTHVSLYVCRDEKGWYLNIAGAAWTRCAEAMQFFLALHRAGIPVCIRQANILKARLTGEEQVGIVPEGVIPAYCEGYFPGMNIIDFINLPYENREAFLHYCVWKDPEPVRLKDGE
ncbi:MAG: hypothetical protein Q4C01_03035 [Clostridia bacterium]|nr:hypothetical protein [Clostridia bacterium]